MQPKITIKPVTPQNWEDLVTVFGEEGACDGCWCMYWRVRHKDFRQMRGTGAREALHGMVERGEVPGLLAYMDGKPVGWCSVGPRESYAALAHSRSLKPIDDLPVWSIVCFYMDRSARGQGLMGALVRGAVDHAKKHGAKLVEAYPVDLQSEKLAGKHLSGDGGYMGIASVFREAGFEVVARPSQTDVIMRYKLGG